MEQSSLTFEKNILRKISGPVADPERDQWRIRFNNELMEETGVIWNTNYINVQRIK